MCFYTLRATLVLLNKASFTEPLCLFVLSDVNLPSLYIELPSVELKVKGKDFFCPERNRQHNFLANSKVLDFVQFVKYVQPASLTCL